MNLVVHKARHPQLNEYIHSAVNGLIPFLTKVCVCVCELFNLLFKTLLLAHSESSWSFPLIHECCSVSAIRI